MRWPDTSNPIAGKTPSHSLGKLLRLYWAFARVGFINTLAFRLRYYTGIVTYFIYVSVYYFIWKAIYQHSTSIEGFDFAHLLTYIGVGWIIRSFYFNNIDQELAYQVIEGRLAMDLIKPVNIQMMYVARAAGESVFRLALLTVPTAVVLFLVYPLRPPSSFGHAGAFLVSVSLSFMIVAAINFAVGTFALRLQSILGLMRAKFFLLELFSGLLLPMTFFPHMVQKILAVMPFEYISYVPMLIYLGKLNGASLGRAIAIQIFWVAILLALGDGLWRWSTRKVIIQGG
jgi:ABC-2 type transport system permease protein